MIKPIDKKTQMNVFSYNLTMASPTKRAKIYVIKKLLKQTQNCQKCLDIGTGRGEIAQHFPKNLKHWTFLEPSLERLEKAKQILSGTFVNTNSDQFFYDNSHSFDLITSFDMVYYLPNESDFYHSCAKALQPGGYLLITSIVDDRKDFVKKIQNYFKVDGQDDIKIQVNQKLSITLLQQQGFSIITAQRYCGPISLLLQIICDILTKNKTESVTDKDESVSLIDKNQPSILKNISLFLIRIVTRICFHFDQILFPKVQYGYALLAKRNSISIDGP